MKEGKNGAIRVDNMRAHAYHPLTKGILCNRTRAYKLRAHTSPRDKENIM